MKNQLKKHRLAKGLTQEQLAKKLGLTQGAIQRWEAESRNIPLNKVPAIASILGIEPCLILFDIVPAQNIPIVGYVNA